MTAALLQELYQWLDDGRQPRLEGWATVDKAMCLMATAWALRPQVAVEIGVWAGRSLLPVALVLRETHRGVIHAIDPWLPDASAEGYDHTNAEWWTKVANHDYAKAQFDDMVNKTGLFPFVSVHRQKSDHVEPPGRIDILHVDGQHTDQARRDVARFGSKVRVGGVVFMDDISWTGTISGVNHVQQAIQDLAALGFFKLYDIGDCSVFQRVAERGPKAVVPLREMSFRPPPPVSRPFAL